MRREIGIAAEHRPAWRTGASERRNGIACTPAPKGRSNLQEIEAGRGDQETLIEDLAGQVRRRPT
jgi:hypothetical protein